MPPELNSPLLALLALCFLHSEAVERWELDTLAIHHTAKPAENVESGHLDSTKHASKQSPSLSPENDNDLWGWGTCGGQRTMCKNGVPPSIVVVSGINLEWPGLAASIFAGHGGKASQVQSCLLQ